MSASRFSIVCVCIALGAAGCVVGPNYKGPPPSTADSAAAFKRAADNTGTAEPAARWWSQLNDPELDRLMAAAIAGSPNVDVAKARLRQARAVLREQRANQLPTTGASAAYLRTRNVTTLLGSSDSNSDSSGSGSSSGSDADSSGSLNLYAVGFDATWEIDFFGARVRAAQGAAAAADAQRANLADVLVTLTADVAQAYIQLRDAQQRLALTQRSVDIETRIVELLKIRQSGGTASELDVQRVINQLDTTRATLPSINAQITRQLDRLAVLTAQAPGTLDEELATSTPLPAPPAAVPIGDPAAMLRRRPDIAVAERRLAQQTASVGQNVAALFPKVNLLGEVGFASLNPQTLFNGSNFTYVVAPILQWAPWDFGRTRARIAQADAARDEAEANYRRVVLEALDDAETSLSQYGQQRNSVTDFARARQSATRVYELTEIRLRGGTAATTDLLDADTRRVQAELSYEQALAQLSQYYVTLQKSLGLGWIEPGAG